MKDDVFVVKNDFYDLLYFLEDRVKLLNKQISKITQDKTIKNNEITTIKELMNNISSTTKQMRKITTK